MRRRRRGTCSTTAAGSRRPMPRAVDARRRAAAVVRGACPNDRNFADVKKQIPGPRVHAQRRADDLRVDHAGRDHRHQRAAAVRRRSPARRCQYVGEHRRRAVPRHAAAAIYYLVSGRWFAAASLDGPWTFATTSLPPDFARIPANGPRGFVLVSVPGTPQAQEALIEAQIPQQATLDRATAKLDVVYAGAPQFAPIPGTPMQYAVNTSFNVDPDRRRLSTRATRARGSPRRAPTGPWALAPTVPAVIYTIPPSSPMYPCTYVRVYAATPDDRHLRLHVRLHDELRQRGRGRLRHRLLLPAVHLSRRRSRSTTRIRIRTRARRTTTRPPARGRRAARSTVRTAASRRRATRTTRTPARGRRAARSTDPTAARARSPRTTRAPAATRTAARCGVRTARRAMRAGTTRTPDAPDPRSRTATRTAAGARARSPGPTRPCTRKARATRTVSAGSFTSTSAARKARACPAPAATARAP